MLCPCHCSKGLERGFTDDVLPISVRDNKSVLQPLCLTPIGRDRALAWTEGPLRAALLPSLQSRKRVRHCCPGLPQVRGGSSLSSPSRASYMPRRPQYPSARHRTVGPGDILPARLLPRVPVTLL